MSDLWLVTGGAGFIGSSVVRALLAEGARVRVLDDLSTGRESNLAEVAADVDFVRASILDPDALREATRGARFVVHLGAQVSVPRSMDDPEETHAINGTGTLRVFEAARREGVERVAYAASCAIYGDDPSMPKREGMTPQPLSPYAVTKYLGEQYAECMTRSMGLEVASLRFFNVYGPRQDPAGGYAAVIPVFITRLLSGRTPIVFGDGTQTRDFVYVESVVEAILAAARTPAAAGRVFNVGTGVQTSLNQLLSTLGELLGVEVRADYQAPRSGDVPHSVADVSRAREVLGWHARHDLATGLGRTVQWYREHR